MTFKHDVFISYAHIDNQALESGQEGWIDHFHRALKIRLAQLRGEEPRIWRDLKLQGNDYFSDTILDQLPQVALLVSVLSPRYMKSEWCLKELQHFYTTANQSGNVRCSDKSRIFKVIKTEVPFEKHPEMIKALIGYAFYESDGISRPREFGEIFGDESEHKYWAKLEDLAYDISKTLELLSAKELSAEEVSAKELAAPLLATAKLTPGQPAKSIYLAEVPINLEDYRDQVRRELELKGYQVVPSEPLPYTPTEFSQSVQRYLQTSTLSVHFISNQPATDEGNALVNLQQQMAIARSQEQIKLASQTAKCNPDFSRILWMPPTHQPLDDYLQTLQGDPDFLSTGLEDLKTFIQDALERPAAMPIAVKGELKILLDCDQEDLNATEIDPLYEFLAQQFDVQLPDYELGSLAASEALVRQCDAVLIYYGHASGLWLKRRVLALKKTLYGRLRPLLAQAIYVADPDKQTTADIPIIRCAGSFQPDLLLPFISQVYQAQRGEQL